MKIVVYFKILILNQTNCDIRQKNIKDSYFQIALTFPLWNLRENREKLINILWKKLEISETRDLKLNQFIFLKQ
jgi:actin-related protein